MTVIEGLPEEPVEPVSRSWTAAISLANLGLFMAYFGPLAVLMPDQIQGISGQAHKVLAFGLVTALAPAIAALAVTYVGGYTTLYFCVGAIVLLGSVAVSRIRSVK